jgi:hypothetical protein
MRAALARRLFRAARYNEHLTVIGRGRVAVVQRVGSLLVKPVPAHHQTPEKDGTEVCYYQIAENAWSAERGHAVANVA